MWAVFVIFPFAVLFFNLVEKPFMRLGDHLRKAIEQKHGQKLKARETKEAQEKEAALSLR